MNIVSILKKLKETNMITASEEGISLFSDSFNKFGISLLLLNNEEKFARIVDILEKNKIPLQKANGIYNLRVFAVDEKVLNDYIVSFASLGEIDFLRSYPEILAAPRSIELVLDNLKNYKGSQVSYKVGSDYNLEVLLRVNKNASSQREKINDFLKKVLKDSTIIEKLSNGIKCNLGDNSNLRFILGKVENKIANDFLQKGLVIVDGLEINSFQNVKNTINEIRDLNISVTFEDALIVGLFYKTSLDIKELEKIFNGNSFEGGR